MTIEGATGEVVTELLYLIQGIYSGIKQNDSKDAETFRKAVTSAVIGFDGFSIWEEPKKSIRFDLGGLRHDH